MKYITNVVTPQGNFAGPEFEARSWPEAEMLAKDSFIEILGTTEERVPTHDRELNKEIMKMVIESWGGVKICDEHSIISRFNTIKNCIYQYPSTVK